MKQKLKPMSEAPFDKEILLYKSASEVYRASGGGGMNPPIFYRVINNSIFRVDNTGSCCSIVILLNHGAWSYYSTWEFLKLCDEYTELGDFLTFDEARAVLSLEAQSKIDEAAAVLTMLTDAEDYMGPLGESTEVEE